MDADISRRFAQVESRLSELTMKINNALSRTSFGNFEVEMKALIDALEAEVTDLKARVEALERGE